MIYDLHLSSWSSGVAFPCGVSPGEDDCADHQRSQQARHAEPHGPPLSVPISRMSEQQGSSPSTAVGRGPHRSLCAADVTTTPQFDRRSGILGSNIPFSPFRLSQVSRVVGRVSPTQSPRRPSNQDGLPSQEWYVQGQKEPWERRGEIHARNTNDGWDGHCRVVGSTRCRKRPFQGGMHVRNRETLRAVTRWKE